MSDEAIHLLGLPLKHTVHNVAYVESTTLQTIPANSADYLEQMDITFPVHKDKRIIVLGQASFYRDSGDAGDVVLYLYVVTAVPSAVSIHLPMIRSGNAGRYAGLVFYSYVPASDANIRFRLACENTLDVAVVSQGNHPYFRRRLMIMELVT